jgi:L-lactate dehydrogenase complex protein LldE
VIETGAEVLCAGDSSCLMHIGGGLSRIRAGVRTLHLAEILASTDMTQRQASAAEQTTTAGSAPPSPRSGAAERSVDGTG